MLWQLLWELALAPIRPGGSWLALKAVPLAVAWVGLVGGGRNARIAVALLLLPAVAESIVRGMSESGRHAAAAWVAFGLAVTAFGSLMRASVRRR